MEAAHDEQQAERAASAAFQFRSAYYIKLGQGGAWEEDAIGTARLRFGWRGQTTADINSSRWDVIESQLRHGQADSQRGAVTRDLKSLRTIVESSPDDLWITFHKGKLWWGRVLDGPVDEDPLSKYRRMHGAWSDRDLNGRLLVASQLPGKLQQIAGYRATQCRVQDPELLSRVIRGARSHVSLELQSLREAASNAACKAIEALHWRDYEILVDMVFRATGWTRDSVLGKQEKGYDLMLREAITSDRYVVQVKSQAGRAEVEEIAAMFPPDLCRRVFFVVHTPAPDLRDDRRLGLPEHVELVDPQRLATLAIQAGLSIWLEEKLA